jgi:hypothetical protein
VKRETGPERDQAASAFGVILEAFLSRVPGALAAALVDLEGETVDYAGQMDPFALRVAAAHFRILLEEMKSQPSLLGGRSLLLRAARRSYLVHVLAEGYALLVVFSRGAGFTGWQRAIIVCTRGLSAEAGWRADKPAWFPAEVVADKRLRPVRVKSGASEQRVEVLGALVGAPDRRERAWRVRLETGVEAMLVRERGGVWYSDEPLGEP